MLRQRTTVAAVSLAARTCPIHRVRRSIAVAAAPDAPDALRTKNPAIPVPEAYSRGTKPFWRSEFLVERGRVLIPRPETELMVEIVLCWLQEQHVVLNMDPTLHGVWTQVQKLRQKQARLPADPSSTPTPTDAAVRLLELGVGSGCVLLSLLNELPSSVGVGVDISADALDVARKNAAVAVSASRVSWFQGSWLDALTADATRTTRKFDVVLSNPPYLKDEHYGGNLVHEPRGALVSGPTGLECYESLRASLERRRALVCDGALIVLEVGQGQADDVSAIFSTLAQDRQVEAFSDLAGIPRMLAFTLDPR